VSFWQSVKHAFSVEESGPAEPTDQQRVPVDWLAQQISKRHLTTPALIAMEMARPLNWVTAQGMHLASPAVWAVAPKPFHEGYKNLASFLEHRGSIEYICDRLEQLEQHYTRKEQVGRNDDDGDDADRTDAVKTHNDEH